MKISESLFNEIVELVEEYISEVSLDYVKKNYVDKAGDELKRLEDKEVSLPDGSPEKEEATKEVNKFKHRKAVIDDKALNYGWKKIKQEEAKKNKKQK